MFSDAPILDLKEVFEQARELYLSQRGGRKKEAPHWLATTSSLNDVVEAIRSAESKYTAKQESHSKVRSMVSSWWSTAAVKIVHFRDIIDTLVSSNPEYVALAWGTIKFLFMVGPVLISRSR